MDGYGPYARKTELINFDTEKSFSNSETPSGKLRNSLIGKIKVWNLQHTPEIPIHLMGSFISRARVELIWEVLCTQQPILSIKYNEISEAWFRFQT